mgnify:CR=1 FL=1
MAAGILDSREVKEVRSLAEGVLDVEISRDRNGSRKDDEPIREPASQGLAMTAKDGGVVFQAATL